MSKLTKRLLSAVLTTVMVISMIVLPSFTASAADSSEATEIPSAHVFYEGDYNTFNEVDEKVADTDTGEMAARYHVDTVPALYVFTQHMGDIGTVPADQLKVNAGYQIYKITYTVPDNAASGAAYLTGNWRPQQYAICGALADHKGETVELYFSIKITGNETDGYDMWWDRVALATTCSFGNYVDNGDGTFTATCGTEGCGKTNTGDAIDVIPAAHQLKEYNLYDNASLFATDENTAVVDDPDAYNGKAVRNTSDAARVEILHYNTSTGDAQEIGELDFAEMASKAGYQVYKFTYEVPAEAASRNLFWLLNNWQLNSSRIGIDLQAYANQTVELYVSIKVEDDGDGTYTTYVDRVAIATPCDTCTKGDTCSVCGEPTEHSFTNYVANDDASFTANATETAVCDNGCGKSDTREIPDTMLTPDPSKHVKELSYTAFYENNGNNTVWVEDSNAHDGWAAANTSDATHVNIAFSSGAGGTIGTLQYADMTSDYQDYTFTYAVPAETTSAMVFLMNNWQFQSTTLGSTLAEYKGQTVEVTFSMKVTGPDANNNNYYTTYVDRVTITTPCNPCTEDGDICSVCGGAQRHSWNDADCDTAKTCSVCGETEGDPLGHSWNAATCDTAKTCSVCGETEGDPLGHKYDDDYDAECNNGCGTIREVKDAVATIGEGDNEVKYASLKAAIDAASDGDTIKLLMSKAGECITITKNITIDFNGKNYTTNSTTEGVPGLTIEGATVTLKNGGLYTRLAHRDKFDTLILNNGTLNVNNMTLKGNLNASDDVVSCVINNNGTVNFSGTTTIVTNGGAQATEFKLSGTVTKESTATVTGLVDFCWNAEGTVLGVHNPTGATCTDPAKCAHCGATEGKVLPHTYTDDCDTTCDVCEKVTRKAPAAVAAIDGINYATLQAAINAAEPGVATTIELKKSIASECVTIAEGKIITIDFKGYNYTTNFTAEGMAGVTIKAGATVTLQSGGLYLRRAHGAQFDTLIWNEGTLKTQNILLRGTYLGEGNDQITEAYTIRNVNGGTFENLGDTTIEKSIKSATSFDIYPTPETV